MADDVQKAVLRVSSSDASNTNFGTCFLIHRDRTDGYVITCEHVLRDVGGPEKALVNDPLVNDPLPVTCIGQDSVADIAILRVENLSLQRQLALCPSGRPGQSFVTAGFYRGGKAYYIRSRQGTLINQAGREVAEQAGRVPVWEISLTGDELQPGNSGSPIVEETSGHAIAVVSAREGRQKGMAISVEAVKTIWKNYPPSIFVENCERFEKFYNLANLDRYPLLKACLAEIPESVWNAAKEETIRIYRSLPLSQVDTGWQRLTSNDTLTSIYDGLIDMCQSEQALKFAACLVYTLESKNSSNYGLKEALNNYMSPELLNEIYAAARSRTQRQDTNFHWCVLVNVDVEGENVKKDANREYKSVRAEKVKVYAWLKKETEKPPKGKKPSKDEKLTIIYQDEMREDMFDSILEKAYKELSEKKYSTNSLTTIKIFLPRKFFAVPMHNWKYDGDPIGILHEVVILSKERREGGYRHERYDRWKAKWQRVQDGELISKCFYPIKETGYTEEQLTSRIVLDDYISVGLSISLNQTDKSLSEQEDFFNAIHKWGIPVAFWPFPQSKAGMPINNTAFLLPDGELREIKKRIRKERIKVYGYNGNNRVNYPGHCLILLWDDPDIKIPPSEPLPEIGVS